MATLTYQVGQMFDDTAAILSAPVVTIASVTDKSGNPIASHGATVNGSATATPISVDYDAETKGEAWITLSVSQSGHTVTQGNATIALYIAKDSGRILAGFDSAGKAALSATGMDAMLTDVTNDSNARSSGMKMLRALFNRFYNAVTQTATQQKVYNDSATLISTMSASDDGSTVTKAKSA